MLNDQMRIIVIETLHWEKKNHNSRMAEVTFIHNHTPEM